MSALTTPTGIRCGNHGREVVYHDSVAAVRNCCARAGQISGPVDAVVPSQPTGPRAARDFGVNPADRFAVPNVSEGRYALDVNGVVKFYKVDRPVQGKWAGRTFVSVQASDDFHPIREFGTRREVLERIAVNPQVAMLRYGQAIGRCGHCNRTLTNEASRARGIGPVCADRMGF